MCSNGGDEEDISTEEANSNTDSSIDRTLLHAIARICVNPAVKVKSALEIKTLGY